MQHQAREASANVAIDRQPVLAAPSKDQDAQYERGYLLRGQHLACRASRSGMVITVVISKECIGVCLEMGQHAIYPAA